MCSTGGQNRNEKDPVLSADIMHAVDIWKHKVDGLIVQMISTLLCLGIIRWFLKGFFSAIVVYPLTVIGIIIWARAYHLSFKALNIKEQSKLHR